MWLFVIVGIVIVGAIIAVIAAMIKIKNNVTEQKNAPEITANAQIIKTYSQSYESYTVDSANARTTSTYYIEFLLESKNRETFKVSKKLFLSVHDGDKGILTYKGNKVIEFQVTDTSCESNNIESKAKYFFQNSQQNGMTVKFYAEASDIDVNIPSTAPIECDYDEICNFVEQIPNITGDNFFSLEKQNGEIIQFSNDGKSDSIEIDIPLENGNSYIGELESIQELKNCIMAFFDGENIAEQYGLSIN